MTDQLQPNVLTVAADGTIGADFTGKVTAEGIDIQMAPSIGAQPVNMIRFLRGDGSVAAELYALDLGSGSPEWRLVALQPGSGNNQAYAEMYTAAGELGPPLAHLFARTNPLLTPHNGAVAEARSDDGTTLHSVTLIDGSGSSSFPGFVVIGRLAGTHGGSGGVTLTDDNGHAITMAWTGSTLQFYVDGTAVPVA